MLWKLSGQQFLFRESGELLGRSGNEVKDYLRHLRCWLSSFPFSSSSSSSSSFSGSLLRCCILVVDMGVVILFMSHRSTSTFPGAAEVSRATRELSTWKPLEAPSSRSARLLGVSRSR